MNLLLTSRSGLTVLLWLQAAATAGVAASLGRNWLVPGLMSAAIAATVTVGAGLSRFRIPAMAIALGSAVSIAILVLQARDTSWQPDAWLYVMAVLALLGLLNDGWAVAVAAAGLSAFVILLGLRSALAQAALAQADLAQAAHTAVLAGALIAEAGVLIALIRRNAALAYAIDRDFFWVPDDDRAPGRFGRRPRPLYFLSQRFSRRVSTVAEMPVGVDTLTHGLTTPALLENVSFGGIALRSVACEMDSGSEVVLRIPGYAPIRAIVIECMEQRVRLQFDPATPKDTLERLRMDCLAGKWSGGSANRPEAAGKRVPTEARAR